MKNNLGLKIFALAVAIFIWLQIILMTEHQSNVNLDLKLTNVTKQDSLPNKDLKIPCVVQGRGIDILKLLLSKTSIEMTASDLRSGRGDTYKVASLPANLHVAILSINTFAVLNKEISSQDSGKQKRTEKDSAFPANSNDRFQTGKESPAASGSVDISDPVSEIVLTNVPLTTSGGMRFFPSEVTLKVSGRSSALSSLPRGLTVQVSEEPDASGMYSLKTVTPSGVTLVDITPKRVHKGK